MMQGLVMNVQKGMWNVKTEQGLLKCRLRGKLFHQQQKEMNLVVVGDQVMVEYLHSDQGLIVEVLERKTKLSRRGVGSKGKHLEQVIAANIDQAVLVCAVQNPSYSLNGIDRYLAAAEAGKIEPVICFNKVDLVDLSVLEKDIEHYQRHGYKVVCTSTLTGAGIEELQELLMNKLSVFTGKSGVGKSSLLNAVENSGLAKTGNVGMTTHKGRHTTTSAQIYELSFGGMLVDTPGMREFGLFDADDGVLALFSDIEELAERCKFSNCSHRQEPGCAVLAALELGELDEQRYSSYLKLRKS